MAHAPVGDAHTALPLEVATPPPATALLQAATDAVAVTVEADDETDVVVVAEAVRGGSGTVAASWHPPSTSQNSSPHQHTARWLHRPARADDTAECADAVVGVANGSMARRLLVASAPLPAEPAAAATRECHSVTPPVAAAANTWPVAGVELALTASMDDERGNEMGGSDGGAPAGKATGAGEAAAAAAGLLTA